MSAFLDECRIIPMSDAPDNTHWLLWHEDAGAHSLAVTTQTAGRRVVELTYARAGLRCSTDVGARLAFQLVRPDRKTAPLPPDAPAGGPELCKAAIAALKSWYEVGTLSIRFGLSEATLHDTLEAATVLARIANPMESFGAITCDLDPSGAVQSTSRLDTKSLKQFVVFEDIRHFYRPYATLGPGLLLIARSQGMGFPHGTLCAAEPQEIQSGHAIMRHVATILSFYDMAAEALKLTPKLVAGRLALLDVASRKDQAS